MSLGVKHIVVVVVVIVAAVLKQVRLADGVDSRQSDINRANATLSHTYKQLNSYSSTTLHLFAALFCHPFTLIGYFMVILQYLIPFDTFAPFNSAFVQSKASNHVLFNSYSFSLHTVRHLCICRAHHHPFSWLSFILSSDRLLVRRLSNRLVRV